MEIDVLQGSKEWFELRYSLGLTASKFGDALGVGRGKPYDFLVSIVIDDPVYEAAGPTRETSHGVRLEPVINEAYELLTGHMTQQSGLWIPDESNILHNIVGASPDAKVFKSDDTSRMLGIAEYKAPVYQMYTVEKHPPHGIPRQYMAQIQGQMAIANQPWCDFMAVCTATRDIKLYKVYFHPIYWSAIAKTIKNFCIILKEALTRKADGLDPLESARMRELKNMSVHNTLYPGENDIIVENILYMDDLGRFKTNRGAYTYEFLMGI